VVKSALLQALVVKVVKALVVKKVLMVPPMPVQLELMVVKVQVKVLEVKVNNP